MAKIQLLGHNYGLLVEGRVQATRAPFEADFKK